MIYFSEEEGRRLGRAEKARRYGRSCLEWTAILLVIVMLITIFGILATHTLPWQW